MFSRAFLVPRPFSTGARLGGLAALSLVVTAGAASIPNRAQACGGTFCDSGPQAMPVDQTGETVLFVITDNYVEAHIRIEYDPTTEATNFAWLVPVPVLPEFFVSSEQLFLNILGATVPIYGTMPTFDPCPDTTGGGSVFISGPDGGAGSVECDLWAQDCRAGSKCMPWANDGGNSWNATRCSPVDPNPAGIGDPCTVEGNGVSGIDNCEKGAMCWGVDPQTNTGSCVALCEGSEADPLCPDGGTCQISNDGVLPLCMADCDPMASECPEGQVCAENGSGSFTCTPVHYAGSVGAFDVVVIGGNDVDEVMQWLGDNGYQQDPAAKPIIEQYIEEGHLFAAFKLKHGADNDTVHPIALRLPGATEACIPLRLTRIAAQDNMKVRALFLGDARTAPSNWRHVTPNPLKIDWANVGANYDEVVTMAVDALPSNGRGFMTEYAGPSDIVPTDGLWSPMWDSGPFAAAEPTAVVDLLTSQGLMACAGDVCTFAHPLLEGVVRQYLPPPAAVAPDTFYSCLSCYADQIDQGAWDAIGFASALDDRIFDPGLRAVEMLQTWPYLTRLFTTISPFEMTIDPLFQENFNLPPVQNITPTATRRRLCNGDSVWVLPDEREVYVPSGSGWPQISNDMPWNEAIDLIPPGSPPLPDANNTDLIDNLLREYNCGFGWPSPEACGDPGDTDGVTTTGDPTGTSGATGDGGTDGTSSGGSQEGDALAVRSCACRANATTPGWAWLGSLAFLLMGCRRRR